MLDVAAIEAAHDRIAPYVRQTPLLKSEHLSQRYGATVMLKMENLQVTGSFKARGAVNKLLSLSPEQRQRGVVSAPSGNHGAAVARAAGVLGIEATLFVPEHAASCKVKAIRRYGAEATLFGQDCVEAETKAREVATNEGKTYVSPYNDHEVAAGQGTIAVELRRQTEAPIDAIFIALGGGGLIGSVGSYLKQTDPNGRVIACSPEKSPAMHECLRAGRIIEVPCYDTLSDGTAGGVEDGSITFDLCRQTIDESILLSEESIKTHLRQFISEEHILIEGAAAVALAGLEQASESIRGKRVVVVLCGANIGPETLCSVLSSDAS